MKNMNTKINLSRFLSISLNFLDSRNHKARKLSLKVLEIERDPDIWGMAQTYTMRFLTKKAENDPT